jgi:hypothetical protein
MRWLLAILFVIVLVLVDRFRFHGYYGREVSRVVQNTIESLNH